jgi:glutaminyl-peptide cyclotransferase
MRYKKGTKVHRDKGTKFYAFIFIILMEAVLATFLPGCKDYTEPVQYSYRIVNIYPHDPNAFTQGLFWEKGFLYEGTGLEGRSSLRKVELQTGKVLQNYNLPAQYFGEGITIFDDFIVQLTYKSGVGFVYDKETFTPLRQFNYSTEGWGLTNNGRQLIMSDGTDNLYFLDSQTFKTVSRVKVTYAGSLVWRINELEYIDGSIYANIWQTDTLVIISPQTGRVTGRIDLGGLLSKEQLKGADVLNGIAYDSEKKRLFVTGKLWPSLFEIELIPQ